MNVQQAGNMWSTANVQVGGGNRSYSTRLPDGYDSTRAYPVIFLLHGCGNDTNNVPMDRVVGNDAILVRGTGSDGTCWNTDANGPDITYIDAMVEDVQARYCTDIGAFFAVGYSSGSWLANQLACARPGVFRGIGTVTGGLPTGAVCRDPVAHIFVHDRDDQDNRIEWDTPGRDQWIMLNGCSNATMPVDPSPCVAYQGCDPEYPIVWCETSGRGHSRQDELAPGAFWDFFRPLIDD